MKQTTAVIIMALILGTAQSVKAQDGAVLMPAQQQGRKTSALDERFDKCMNDDSCTMRERLQLLGEMSDDMRETLMQMDRSCAMMDYNECIGPQRDERENWHKMNGRMKDMMQSLEMRTLNQGVNKSAASSAEKQKIAVPVNRIEPSAGEDRGEKKKRFWWWPQFK